MDIPPNQTIYVHNLFEKLPKDELKKCLYAMFSQFGRILDVVCLKTIRLRGQAWVVFADVAAATNALRSMQGFPFFDKPIRIEYAKTLSDAVAKIQGSYKPNQKERQQKNAAARDQLIQRGAAKAAAGGKGGPGSAPAHKILFVQNLPEGTTDSMLSMLFKQFPGFQEVRMVPARPGIAFVEFENDLQATTAMSGLQNFQIAPSHAMQITYAKQ